jgi:hypothetical protein
MKVSVTDKQQGAVWGQATVTMTELTQAETDELRAALKVVDRYRLRAHRAAGMSPAPKGGDWSMVDFCVKTDTVVCTVQVGACG